MIGQLFCGLIKWGFILALPLLAFDWLRNSLGSSISGSISYQLGVVPLSDAGMFIGEFFRALMPGLVLMSIWGGGYKAGFGTKIHFQVVSLVSLCLCFVGIYGNIMGVYGSLYAAAKDGCEKLYMPGVGGGVLAAIVLLVVFFLFVSGPVHHHIDKDGRRVLKFGRYRSRFASSFELWWWPLNSVFNQKGLIVGERCRIDLEPDWTANPVMSAVANLSSACGIPLSGGGYAPLIRINPKGHFALIGGSGSGKTTGFIEPNLRAIHDTSFVVLDLKGELWRNTSKIRELWGRRELFLDPTDSTTWGCNLVAGMGRDPYTRDTDAAKCCGWLEGVTGKGESGGGNSMFSRLGWMLTRGTMVGVMARATAEGRDWSLSEVASIFMQPEPVVMATLNQLIMEHPECRQQIEGAMVEAKETFSGVIANAKSALADFASPTGARLFSGAADRNFEIEDLLDGNTDLYIRVDRDLLPQLAGGLQIMIGAITSRVATMCKNKHPLTKGGSLRNQMVFFLDEAPQLFGGAKNCAIMAGIEVARGWNIVFFVCCQSRGQIYDAYGKEKGKVFEDSCIVKIYIQIEDDETCKLLETQSGLVSVETRSVNEGQSGSTSFGAGGGLNESRGLQLGEDKEALLPAWMIRQMRVDSAGVPNEAILMIRGRKMARVGVCRWYRRPSMLWLDRIGKEAGPVIGPSYQ